MGYLLNRIVWDYLHMCSPLFLFTIKDDHHTDVVTNKSPLNDDLQQGILWY